jgi:hypothetical protein
MKSSLPLLLAGLGGLLIVSSGKSPNKKAISKKSAEDPYEEFPPDVNVKLNQDNIYHYYSSEPVWLKNIPEIFGDLNPNLIEYYNKWNTEKSFIRINPVFAVQVYNYAKVLLINNPQKYIAKTSKEAEVLTKEILLKFSPDIYWKEGLIPYVYKSAFYYVWVSVTFLVLLAWANINDLWVPGEI